MKERRKTSRVNLNCPIEIIHPTGRLEMARIKNLSQNGICIVVEQNDFMTVDHIYEIMFELPHMSELVDIQALSSVLSIRDVDNHNAEVSMAFVGIADSDVTLLQRYVNTVKHHEDLTIAA